MQVVSMIAADDEQGSPGDVLLAPLSPCQSFLMTFSIFRYVMETTISIGPKLAATCQTVAVKANKQQPPSLFSCILNWLLLYICLTRNTN